MGPFPEKFCLMWNTGRVGWQLRRKCWCFYFQQKVPKWVCERPGFRFLMLEGTCNPTQSWAVLEDSFNCSWAGLHRRPGCAWAGLGGDGLVACWLGLQGEGRLVRRQSSGWIKPSLLWAVAGEEESVSPSVPALLMCSALRLLTLVLVPGSLAVPACLWWQGLLFAVPPAHGWLTSCLSNSLETFLFSDFCLQSEAISEACERNCTGLPGATLHYFLFPWAGWQGNALPVEMLHSSQGALFVSRAGCSQPEDLSQEGQHERRWGQDAGVGADLWVHCGLCGVWLCCTCSQTLVFTDVKARHRKIIKGMTNLSGTALTGFKVQRQAIWLSWGTQCKPRGAVGCSGNTPALCATVEQKSSLRIRNMCMYMHSCTQTGSRGKVNASVWISAGISYWEHFPV